ncbi:mCG148406 [Mus musculus]|jgi:hypothetical protein|nr:mCG148406 [Mus musculus]
MFGSVYVCTPYLCMVAPPTPNPRGQQRAGTRVRDGYESLRVMEMEPRSSERAARAVIQCAISPVPTLHFYQPCVKVSNFAIV